LLNHPKSNDLPKGRPWKAKEQPFLNAFAITADEDDVPDLSCNILRLLLDLSPDLDFPSQNYYICCRGPATGIALCLSRHCQFR
jgi:hypothetical protein